MGKTKITIMRVDKGTEVRYQNFSFNRPGRIDIKKIEGISQKGLHIFNETGNLLGSLFTFGEFEIVEKDNFIEIKIKEERNEPD